MGRAIAGREFRSGPSRWPADLNAPPPAQPTWRHTAGVTLVELLVALAIAALVMLVAGALLSTARAGERVLNDGVDPQRALELAAELLREELSLAGFVPWQPTGDGEPAPHGADVERIVVSGAGTPSQEVALAFVDDRLASGPLLRRFGYSADRDGRGLPQLYRRSGDSSRQPVVQGVAQLQVTGYADANGLHPIAGPVDAEVEAAWALTLELSAATGETRALLVELPSRPSLVVVP